MGRIFLMLLLAGAGWYAQAQPSTLPGLQQAFQSFLKDEQLRYASVSLYVVEVKTGQPVLAYNQDMGLAPASTLKLLTSATALDALGSGFRFKTTFSLAGRRQGNTWKGNLVMEGDGDPSLGSQRFASSSAQALQTKLLAALEKAGIQDIDGQVTATASGYDPQRIPDGWIYEDVGNYYGAGSSGINWNENKYDLVLKTPLLRGKPVHVLRTVPAQPIEFDNHITTAASGSGDNAYIYPLPGMNRALLKGTVPCCVDSFVISGAIWAPEQTAVLEMQTALQKKGLLPATITDTPGKRMDTDTDSLLLTHLSPTLDSLVYWFNRKSINLYGEALLKKMALLNKGKADTETGIDWLKEYWKQKGIDPRALNLYDGSGLSPLNRITTAAQVTVLLYARKQPWYDAFYQSLPEYNGMKMKSGTISNVKGFTGYHRSKTGREYAFAFLVNNYNGTGSALTQKMFKVLDQLK